MKLSDFDYYLPKELIAQYPLKERDSARLLVVDRSKAVIEHRQFRDLTDYFSRDDLLVLNDTKVLCLRLKGFRLSGGKVEILLLNPINGQKGLAWDKGFSAGKNCRSQQLLKFRALVKPSRVKINEKIIFPAQDGIPDTFCVMTAKDEVAFSHSAWEAVYKMGKVPLPPYIKREPEALDTVYYQTVYARHEGSIASPTAGLHFTEDFLGRIKKTGISIAHITLHVGYSTFKPVKSEDIRDHKMEKEFFRIDSESETIIKNTRSSGGRICAVGTTSTRALEAYALGMSKGETDLFIYPGYPFKMTDALITNFHLPRTTLFLLVCAFAGEKLIKRAYEEAVQKKYRFYSYGDAMLIL